MPVFKIMRTWPKEALEEDSEMGHVRAIAGGWSEPRFTWLRSFGHTTPDGAIGFCVYEGPGARELAIQQRLCGMPVDEVREVAEICGASDGPGIDAVPEGWSLFWVERQLPPGSRPSSVVGLNAPHAEGAGGALWLRSFFDRERASSVCIFAAASADPVRAAVAAGGVEPLHFEQAGSDHPALWAHIYDRLGLPRHWERDLDAAPG
jgi:hypothetical protein